MRSALLLGWVIGGCGRLAFDPLATSDATDALPSGATVIADWSATNPYNAHDFLDSTDWSGNAPRAVTSLTAPFADGFAVSIGRSILEIHLDGTVIAHDYRPAASETTGPDNIARLAEAATPDVGPGIWLGVTSVGSGDGLFRIDPSWVVSRETSNNNVIGIAFDPTGSFESVGVDTIYYSRGNVGLVRRVDAAGNQVQIWNTSVDVGSCAVSATAIYAIDADGDGLPRRLYRIDPMTHVSTQIDESTDIVVAQGPVPAGGPIGIRDRQMLEQWDPTGAGHTVLATAPDASTHWIDVTIPRPPHPLAGRMIILEWNVDADRQRILLMP